MHGRSTKGRRAAVHRRAVEKAIAGHGGALLVTHLDMVQARRTLSASRMFGQGWRPCCNADAYTPGGRVWPREVA